MRIQTNVSSLNAQRAIREHNSKIESSSGKLSSGMRVRNASDDAASLSIGVKQSAQVRSQHQAMRNANDAISEFQVAEGAMNEIGSMLTRLRELSLQAATDTLAPSDRALVNNEYMQLRQEIERISASSQFRGHYLLRDGSNRERDFVVGTHSDDDSKISVNSSDMVVTEFSLGLVDSSVSNADEARENLKYIDQAVQKLSTNRARVGSIQNRLEFAASNLSTSKLNEQSSLSTRMDLDFALETAEKMKTENKLKAASSVLSQTNQIGANALKLIG
jgi:flagellin